MRNLFTHHEFRIPDTEFSLWAFGDMHDGTSAFDEDRFEWFIEKSQKSKNPYYIGLGDYSDFVSMSENKKLKNADVHDTTAELLDTMAININKKIAKRFEKMRGRLIGLIGGNHQFTLSSGKLSDEDLAERLGTRYLGWLSIINLIFPSIKPEQDQRCYIFACHGKSGGKLIGTSINQVDDMTRVINNADIYIMGHDHKRSATPKTVLNIYENNHAVGTLLKQKRQYLVRSGSFQKSYEKDKSGYAQGKLLQPADLGAVRLNIGTHYDTKDNMYRVILDIEGVI